MKSRESLLKQRQFELIEKRRKVADLESMIAEFTRMAEDLDQQIEAEEARSGITDVKHFAYPPFAKAAHGRRANLVDSVADLNDRLEDSRTALSHAEEETRKAELLGERAAESMQAPRRPGRSAGGPRFGSANRTPSRAF